MARLPAPGSDDGSWGDILNTYLAQAHNGDGTLKDTGIIAAKANDTSVVHTTGNESIAGVKTFTTSPIVPTPTNATDAASKSYADATITQLNAHINDPTAAHAASAIGFTPAGSVAATDVQAAIVELDGDRTMYKGTWNAATNTPTLANGTGTQGDFYRVSVAGTHDFGSGSITFSVGDYALYDTGIWTKVAGPTDTMPWSIELSPFTKPATQTTWSSLIAFSTQLYGGWLQSGTTQGSQIGWDINLAAGTWTISLLALKASDAGIITIALDGVSVGTLDLYAASNSANQVLNLSGVAVANSGNKRLTLTLSTKNGASSAYAGYLSWVSLRRTA